MFVSAVKGILWAAIAIAIAVWYRRVDPDAQARQKEIRRADERLDMLKRVAAETDPAVALRLLDDVDRRFGSTPLARRPRKPLSAGAVARRDALLADLRAIGIRDPAETKRLLEKHVNAYAREMTTKLTIYGAALAGLMVAVLVLFGE